MDNVSIEQLAAIFGTYLPAEVLYKDGTIWEVLGIQKSHVAGRYKRKNEKDTLRAFSSNMLGECQLMLTPLLDITDEHAIEVAKMATRYGEDMEFDKLEIYIDQRDSESTKVRVGGALVSIYYDRRVVVCNSFAPFIFAPAYNTVEIADYLRQQGYDCGFGPIQSLIDAKIAVKKEVKNG